MSLTVDEARARFDRALAAAKAAEGASDDYFFAHPYGGPESETLLEASIAADAERRRALLAMRRAMGRALGAP
jgi:hypothetical protein